MYGYGHELDSMGAVDYQRAMSALSGRALPRTSLAAAGGLSALQALQGLAAAPAPLSRIQAAQQAQAAGISAASLAQAQQAVVAQEVEASRGDFLYYGVDSGAANIGAGATATLTVTPQKRHIPTTIRLSSNVADRFAITDIRVGVEPVLATVGAISAAIFIQDSEAPAFRATVCEIGTDFSITVENMTGAPARFLCTVVGRYLPGWVR